MWWFRRRRVDTGVVLVWKDGRHHWELWYKGVLFSSENELEHAVSKLNTLIHMGGKGAVE